MELEVLGDKIIRVLGDVSITLPDYMTSLSRDQVFAARGMSNIIIACGRHGGDIIMVTGDRRLFKLNIIENGLPNEDCMPIERGRIVLFPQAALKNNTSYEVHAQALLNLATEMNVVIEGEPTYLGENTVRNPEEGYP